MPDEEASSHGSEDADGPAGALAHGGARSLQLRERQAARLERRLQQHREPASATARGSASAEASGTPVGSVSGAWRGVAAESALDGKLALDRSMRTPAATSRAGPHAVLSGLAQRAASAAIGTVRHLAGGATPIRQIRSLELTPTIMTVRHGACGRGLTRRRRRRAARTRRVVRARAASSTFRSSVGTTPKRHRRVPSFSRPSSVRVRRRRRLSQRYANSEIATARETPEPGRQETGGGARRRHRGASRSQERPRGRVYERAERAAASDAVRCEPASAQDGEGGCG